MKKLKNMKPLELRAYHIFKNKLGHRDARTIIEYIETKPEKQFREKSNEFAAKKDIVRIDGETNLLKKEDNQLRKAIDDLSVEVINRLAETKTEIIKWSLVFWVGTVSAMIAIVKIFVNK